MLGKLLSGFIIVIVGVNLLPALADSVTSAQTQTNAFSAGNKTVTLGTGPAGVALTNADLAHQTTAISCVTNATGVGTVVGSVNSYACLVSGNYTYTQAGYVVNATPSLFAGQNVNVTYTGTYTSSNQNLGGSASTITGLVVLFYAIGVMAAGILVGIEGLKDAELM